MCLHSNSKEAAPQRSQQPTCRRRGWASPTSFQISHWPSGFLNSPARQTGHFQSKQVICPVLETHHLRELGSLDSSGCTVLLSTELRLVSATLWLQGSPLGPGNEHSSPLFSHEAVGESLTAVCGILRGRCESRGPARRLLQPFRLQRWGGLA